MKPGRQTLLVLCCGGMEITWRYAWAFFFTLLIFNHPMPLPEALAVFIAASAASLLTGERCWRRYQSIAFHITGFSAAWLLTTYRFYYRRVPFFNISWIQDLFERLREPQLWLIQLPVLACLLLFWLGARAMVKRQQSYYPVCLQFDRGLGAFFLLLLIKFTVQAKGGIRLEDPVTQYLLFAFFTFSLIAISLSRNQSDVRKTFRPGYHGIGIVLGFVSVVLIGSAVFIVLFLPYLTLVAESAQSVLKATAAPMVPGLVHFIRFLFSIGRYRRDLGIQITSDLKNQLYPDSEIGWMHGLGWIMLGVFGLIALGLCGYLIHLLVRWLLKKSSGDELQDLKFPVSRLVSMLAAIILNLWNGLLFLLKKIDSAAAVYAGLLRWGRRSGLPAVSSETPVEYGGRLKQRFPRLKTEIEMIVEAFNREIYGQIPPQKRILDRIRSAQGRMRNPRHWPSRMKAWFTAPSAAARSQNSFDF